MSSIDFFTPIQYQVDGSWKTWMRQGIEDYFTFSSKQEAAFETTEKGKYVLHERQAQGACSTALKTASYFTIILPLIVLLAKAVNRLFTDVEIYNLKAGIS